MYRRTRMPSVWSELDQLQREMNHLVGPYLGSRPLQSLGFPAINIWTNEDAQIITAELPGMRAEDIEINISADKLFMSGERVPDQLDGEVQPHRRERSYGRFSRSIQLPFMVDTNRVEAVMKNGILEISLFRAESDKPQKIAVKMA